jgi:hypothetical protein
MRNRNLVQAQVHVESDAYTAMLAGASVAPLVADVTAAMNRKAAERNRRVFGQVRQLDAIEADGLVALTFEAYTEPA